MIIRKGRNIPSAVFAFQSCQAITFFICHYMGREGESQRKDVNPGGIRSGSPAILLGYYYHFLNKAKGIIHILNKNKFPSFIMKAECV